MAPDAPASDYEPGWQPLALACWVAAGGPCRRLPATREVAALSHPKRGPWRRDLGEREIEVLHATDRPRHLGPPVQRRCRPPLMPPGYRLLGGQRTIRPREDVKSDINKMSNEHRPIRSMLTAMRTIRRLRWLHRLSSATRYLALSTSWRREQGKPRHGAARCDDDRVRLHPPYNGHCMTCTRAAKPAASKDWVCGKAAQWLSPLSERFRANGPNAMPRRLPRLCRGSWLF